MAELARGDHVTPTDIRNEVPIAPIVSAALEAVVPDTVDVGDVTTILIDFVLVHAVPRQGRAARRRRWHCASFRALPPVWFRVSTRTRATSGSLDGVDTTARD